MKTKFLRLVSFVSVLLLMTSALLIESCKKSNAGPAPVIASFVPASAAKDSTVMIAGINFSTTASANAVTFNGVAATVLSATDTTLTVRVPLHARDGKISVRVNGQTTSSANDFTYILTVSTLAGDGTYGFKDGPGTTAQFKAPSDIAVDASGNVYVADMVNNRIRKITPAGVVSAIAGDGTLGFKDGPGATAQFKYPTGIAVDASGNVYVADQGNQRIRKITPAGVVNTIAGDGIAGFKEGTGIAAEFVNPSGVALDASGNVYIADQGNQRIRKMTAAGVVSTIAGDGTNGFKDGPAAAAQFFYPYHITVDASGNIYVADQNNQRIRKITAAGIVSTIAGDGTQAFKDATGTAAQFNYPSGVAVDAAGNVYVADYFNNAIRKITTAEVVSTIAGDRIYGFIDGPGTVAEFKRPDGIAIDASGNIYVADYEGNRVRKLQ